MLNFQYKTHKKRDPIHFELLHILPNGTNIATLKKYPSPNTTSIISAVYTPYSKTRTVFYLRITISFKISTTVPFTYNKHQQ
jgi:hypothetical protein